MFNIRLRDLRLKKGLTQDELGKILNVSGKTIGTWERDSRQPNIETINELANYFGVTTDYLLGRTPTPSFTAKDERDIQKVVGDLIDGLSNENSLAYLRNGGEEIDEDDAELIKAALEKVARRSKILAKEKFTPDKYK
ncbi:helix-turn-helix domain-containing protein [Ligilactobacillus faecis]|uniref:helix-turn-helix domain-containing protein n=1 Tax=Ligilactobacillus faecis TaxID=762833 RepID=UPI0024693489|nr:helix-turn-helix transcriptional regulator [Ligilactobacillus faecis]WGN89818.1 helix-turn-helix transcriptional regulator [Ligilactobacillus faecis]